MLMWAGTTAVAVIMSPLPRGDSEMDATRDNPFPAVSRPLFSQCCSVNAGLVGIGPDPAVARTD